MKKLGPIPLPTVAAPKTKPMRTTSVGMTWNPGGSTKAQNLKLKHARDYNQVTRGLSILNTTGLCDEDS